MQVLHLGLIFTTVFAGVLTQIDFVHHDNQALQSYLQNVSTRYPDLTKLYSIGKSNNDFDLWVIAIGRDIDSYVELRPHVKYIGNMHGNEVVSREVLMHLIEYYVTSYETNTTVQTYLNRTVVHIMPSMNPDGYSVSSEGDCQGVVGRRNTEDLDLNRNFPDPWHNRHQKPIGTETQLVINWLSTHNFVLSANLHGGAMVANYPYDQYLDINQQTGLSVCPDDDVFRYLSLIYSRSHHSMAATNGTVCEGDFFLDGITNGADWYAVAGGMQDYNYLQFGIFELCLEISCCKFPNATDLTWYWEENKDALVNYFLEVHRGVKGVVRDENNNTVQNVTLSIEGRESVPFMSRLYGEYYRILMPGTYNLQVSADNYKPMKKQFTVTDGVTLFDIQLEPTESLTTGSPTTETPSSSALPVRPSALSSLLKGTVLCLIVICLL